MDSNIIPMVHNNEINQPLLSNNKNQSDNNNKSNFKILNSNTTTIPPKVCLYISKYKNTPDNFFLFTPTYEDANLHFVKSIHSLEKTRS